MNSFLTRINKADLDIPKQPTKVQLETKHKIMKNSDGFKFLKVD